MTAEIYRDAIPRLLERLDRLEGQWPMTGGALCVVSKDRVLGQGTFGKTFKGAPMPSDRLFEIGSISKTFAGLMIAELVERGLCDIDAPVTRYLPWFAVKSDYAPFTLRHLLHHTSGMVKGADDPPDELGQCWSLRNTVTATAPGTFFHYSNLGYVLLGLIIKSLSGITAPDFCRENIVSPLGMQNTITRITGVDRYRIAVGTVPEQEDRPWVPGDRLAPATWIEAEAADGNIASTAGDMGLFMRMLLGQGMFEGRSILSAGSVQRIWGDLAVGGEDSVTGFGGRPVAASNYGYGVNVEQIDGHACLTHGGGMVGYSSFLLIDRTAGIGICALTNGNGCYPIGETIARLGHAMLLATDATDPVLDLDLRTESPEFDATMTGDFVAANASNGPRSFSIVEQNGGVHLKAGGRSGKLYRGWSSRFATDHPDFRRFNLGFTNAAGAPEWSFGDETYRREGVVESALNASEDIQRDNAERYRTYVGRYRSYSPWSPTFRILVRGGGLFLVAPGGVEAPRADGEPIELAPALLRLGRDERLPERLQMGPIVDGKTILATRDGCRYSRVSTD